MGNAVGKLIGIFSEKYPNALLLHAGEMLRRQPLARGDTTIIG